MVGATLREMRERVDALASLDGPFVVACARTGERPVPVTALRFADRPIAVEAAEIVTSYRAALREYDPQVPRYDLIVHDCADGDARPRRDPPAQAPTIDFCHEVVAATFEALSTCGHGDLERAVMDAYFALAETTTDRDELCLCLLGCLLAELEGLSRTAQSEVARTAAASLPFELAPVGDPLEVTMRRLRSAAVVRDYAVASADGCGWEVVLDGYALSTNSGRLATFPIAVELLGRVGADAVAFDAATPTDAGWRLAVRPTAGTSRGVVSLPVEGGAWP